MAISEHRTFSILEPKLHKIWNSFYAAGEDYQKYPDRTLHRKATRAAIQNDLTFANLISAFDEVADCRIVADRKRNLRFLEIEERILLWVKKVDSRRIPSNYPTEHATDLLQGQQFELMPKASIIVVGYLLDPDEVHVKRLSFAPPSFKKKPDWFFDVSLRAKTIAMSGPQSISKEETRLVVTRGEKQINLL